MRTETQTEAKAGRARDHKPALSEAKGCQKFLTGKGTASLMPESPQKGATAKNSETLGKAGNGTASLMPESPQKGATAKNSETLGKTGKGTASAVPITSAKDNGALAPEVANDGRRATDDVLPPACLHHARLIHCAHGQAFHCAGHIRRYFK